MHTSRKAKLFTIALMVTGLCTVTSPATADDWEWSVTPYLWASDIGIDVFVHDEPIIGSDIAFSDIFDKLEVAFPIHVEVHREKLGIFLDVMYINLGDTQTTVADPPLPDDTVVGSDLKQLLFEAGGFYRPSGGTHGLDVLFGVRVIDFDMTIDFSLPAPSTVTSQVSSAKTFTDGFIGLRYSAPLGERTSFAIRGDAGSGGSELTWNASALLGYTIGKKRQNRILIGYRHMEIELKDSRNSLPVESNVTMSGPITGFMIRF